MKTIYESYNEKDDLLRTFLDSGKKSKSKDVEIKRGEFIYHITPLKFESIYPKQFLFASHCQYDRDLYKSYLSLKLLKKGYRSIKEIVLEVKRSLYAPNLHTQKSIFYEAFYKENNYNDFENDLKQFDCKYFAYEEYMEHLSDLSSSVSFNIFYNNLLDHGYNAIMDEHDIKMSWIQAKSPICFPDASDFVRIHKIKTIKLDNIIDSLISIGEISQK